MQHKTLIASLVTTCTLFLSAAAPAAPQSAFTPAQTAEIGKIAGDYLLAHPDILVQVSQLLMAQQAARQQALSAAKVMEQQKALLHDPDTPEGRALNCCVESVWWLDNQPRSVRSRPQLSADNRFMTTAFSFPIMTSVEVGKTGYCLKNQP